MTVATVTSGTIAGYGFIVVALLCCAASIWFGLQLLGDRYERGLGKGLIGLGIVGALLTFPIWWWGMAFTTSADYHAWNVKQGKVTQVSKRLIATDSGMSERFVVVVDGQPLGIDDTRASLIHEGDEINLRCKKDYQWGVPRSAHGWACRWNGGQS